MGLTNTEIKQVDEEGINFLIKEEGLRLTAYQDSVGVWTISIGCTYYLNGSKVKKGDTLTKEQALVLFRNILSHYESIVYSITRDDINQHQFNALVSICYNIGVNAFKGSTLVKRVNANPQDPTIIDAFKMWKNAGSKPVLLGRRIREANLYFK